jgi:hypothetical protein
VTRKSRTLYYHCCNVTEMYLLRWPLNVLTEMGVERSAWRTAIGKRRRRGGVSFNANIFVFRVGSFFARSSLLVPHYTYASRAQLASARLGSNSRPCFCRHTALASLRI